MTTVGTMAIITIFALMQSINIYMVKADCITDLKDYFQEPVLMIQEHTKTGDVLANITTEDELMFLPNSANSEFIGVDAGNLVAIVDIEVDGQNNTDLCRKVSSLNEYLIIKCMNDTSGVHQKWFVIQFNLTDDFEPTMGSHYEAAAAERKPPGTLVFQPQKYASDEDCRSSFMFIVQNDSAQNFEMDGNNNLVLARELDFELQQEHQVNITVITWVYPVTYKNVNTTLTVRVTDVDDTGPVFDVGLFELHVTESLDAPWIWQKTSPLLQARDGDIGVNATLIYSVESVTPNLVLEIQNETGEVRVLESLDRENISSYIVVVKAAQTDLAYKTATATISVIVDDVNDNRPVYTSLTDVTISGDSPNGSIVLELSGDDADQGENSLFDFVIGANSIGAFGVTTAPGVRRSLLVVTNSTALPGHGEALVEVRLIERTPASGGVTCDFTTTCVANVAVHILDSNDHSPVFRESRYRFLVPSNSSSNTTVGRVEAVDADRGDNGRVIYSLPLLITGPTECSNFNIDPGMGTLNLTSLVAAGIDCSWLVSACDSPTDPASRRCSSAYVAVTVVLSGDIVQLNVAVPENVPKDTVVTLMSIKDLSTTSQDFLIKDNVLYTNADLDRESRDNYQVPVFSIQDTTSIVMLINVSVGDMNDNAPVFDYPNYTIVLNDNSTIGQVLLQVKASDRDIGNNSLLTYSLVSGQDWFDIDPSTGQIRLINFLTSNSSEYQLLATDSGQPRLQGLASLIVYSPVYNETAILLLPVSKGDLMADREGIAQKLSFILGVTVTIYTIEGLGPVPDIGSRLYIGATLDGTLVNATHLNWLLNEKASDIYKSFLKASPDDNDDDGLSVLEIVLICVSAVLLLMLIVAVILWARNHHKYKQSVRLFAKLNRNTAIYDNPGKCSTKPAAAANLDLVSNPEQMARHDNGSLSNNSLTNLLPVSGFVNPGYHYNGDTTGADDSPESRAYNHIGLHADWQHHLLSSDPAFEERVTRFGSQETNNMATASSPAHVTTTDVHLSPQRPTHIHTYLDPKERRQTGVISPPSKSFMSSNEETHHADDSDDNDQEVAHILAEINNIAYNHQGDHTALSTNRSDSDLMTAFKGPGGHGDTKTNPWVDEVGPYLLPEPEPDYAKKVRFNEPASSQGSKDSLSSPYVDAASSASKNTMNISDEITAL